MLLSTGSQRVGHDLVTEQQQSESEFGFSKARVLEWVAVAFSKESS